MATVTYHNQPAIEATKGAVPIGGTRHPYTVSKLLWDDSLHRWIARRIVGKALHLCCGQSPLGDCRLDLFQHDVDVAADAARVPFADGSWDTVLVDPPYNGKFQWNHDLLSELARVARQRIIFQHWFLPCNREGAYKKAHRFRLSDVAVWQPRTYFGRAQVISIP